MANLEAKYSIMTQEMVDSFCDNFYIPAEVHPTASGHGKTITQFPVEMGLFDFIKTADPRKVQAVEVQKGDDQVTLLKSTRHCFMPLVIPAARGSSSAAAAEVSALTGEGQEDVAPEEACLELADPDEGTTVARQSEDEVVTEQPKKMRLASSRLPDQEQLAFCNTLKSEHATKCLISSTLGIPVDTTAAAITSTRAAVNPDLAGPSQPEESEGSDDSFYEPPTLDPSEWTALLPPALFSALRTMDYDQLYMEFNVGAARQVCLGSEVRSSAEHELELKEKLRAKYAARGRLLEEKDLEILRLKSELAKMEAEAAEVIRLRDQVSSLSEDKSALTAEVSVLKVTVT
ncbi:hypothetical protein Tco_1212882 [Tanacetum coccineum]